MLPNVMVLAPLQELKIKYELGDATSGYILKTNNPFLFVLGTSIL
jgi:hypothetical protein